MRAMPRAGGKLVGFAPYQALVALIHASPRRQFILLAAFPAIWVLTQHLGPIVQMLYVSFTDAYPVTKGVETRLTLENYRRFFDEEFYRIPFYRTLAFATTFTFATLVITYPIRVLPDTDRQPPKSVAHASPAADSVLGRRDRAHLRNHDPARQQRGGEPPPEVARPDRATDTVHVHRVFHQRRDHLPDRALHAPAALLRPGEAPAELCRGRRGPRGGTVHAVSEDHLAAHPRRHRIRLHTGVPDFHGLLRYAGAAGRTVHDGIRRNDRGILLCGRRRVAHRSGLRHDHVLHGPRPWSSCSSAS